MNFFHQFHTEPQIIHNQKICFEPHIHSEVEIIAVFDGFAKLIANGCEYNVEAGDFIVIFPNIIHSYTLEKNVDVGKFIFNPNDMSDFNFIFEKKIPESPIIRRNIASKTTLPSLAREILDCYKNSSTAVKKAYLLLLTGKLLELCNLKEKNVYNDNIVFKILEYCKNNFSSKIGLEDVANALYVSKSCVSHVFCCKLKINFRNYINLLRINQATVLLRTQNMNITEIAAYSGFGSIRSFNRAFAKVVGVTPKEYKKNLSLKGE